MEYHINQFDLFFITYNEPLAEEFWADLQEKVPWAKRVNNIKGFDSAHRECANQSETPFLLTVDGDNLIDPKIMDLKINISEEQYDWAWSWNGLNYVTGLTYGNGGIKLWSKDFIFNMHSHENSTDSKHSVDFCWNNKYKHLPGCYSTSYTNGTPFQAFRSGFREGVKMSLHEGERLSYSSLKNNIWHENLNRLIVWCSIGADVEYGDWSIYGARLGAVKSLIENWDHTLINNYDWFETYWKEEISPLYNGNDIYCIRSNYGYNKSLLQLDITKLGNKLKSEVSLDICEIDPNTSLFIKKYYSKANV